MANQWFRMYHEFATDPKVQSMPVTSQRHFIMLLCLQCDTSLKNLSEEELAFALRIDIKELQENKELFIKKGFIDEDWSILNWDKRQYKSDSSAERTRAYRERKKNETGKKSHSDKKQKKCDVTVTPPDTDTDTDTDIKEYVVSENVLKFLNQKTKKNFRAVESNLNLIRSRLSEGYTEDDLKNVIVSRCAKWLGDPKMSEYLRPTTIFGKEKFSQYVGEAGETSEEWDEVFGGAV